MTRTRRNFIKTAGAAALGIPFLSSFRLSSFDENTGIEIIKPKGLKPGDTIAISSPAGAVWDEKSIAEFIEILEEMGFKVVKGRTLYSRHGYFAGTDEIRAKEINDFFSDPNISAIFSMKGGWGCARLFSMIDYENIRKNPKIIMGFSDITSLLIAIYAKTGLVTFHGPVGNSSWGEFSMRYVKKVLIEKEKALMMSTGKMDDKGMTLNSGKAKGVLVGGNLSVVTSIIGSNYLPDWKNKILFLEERGEEPYRVDRMLTQLKLAGVLDNISGFVFGKCKCEAEEPEKAFTYQQVFEQHIKPLKIPAFYNSMIGHIENKFTLPIGIEAEIDADKGTIQLLDTAVI